MLVDYYGLASSTMVASPQAIALPNRIRDS
jgi:hypothetical protein